MNRFFCPTSRVPQFLGAPLLMVRVYQHESDAISENKVRHLYQPESTAGRLVSAELFQFLVQILSGPVVMLLTIVSQQPKRTFNMLTAQSTDACRSTFQPANKKRGDKNKIKEKRVTTTRGQPESQLAPSPL